MISIYYHVALYIGCFQVMEHELIVYLWSNFSATGMAVWL